MAVMLGACLAIVTTLTQNVEGQRAPKPVAKDYESYKSVYDASLRRPSLLIRTRAMERLASTGDERAFKLLSKRYEKPEDPADHVKYLITGILRRHFEAAEHADEFIGWAKRNTEAIDAWLWFNAMDIAALADKEQDLLAAAGPKRPWLRGALLTALGKSPVDETGLKLAGEILAAPLPEKAVERALAIESCATLVAGAKGEREGAAFANIVQTLAGMLELKDTPERSKLTIARCLARAFEHDKVYLNAAPWLALLAKRSSNPQATGRQTRPRFIGIEASGKRVAYVIDMSDSMLEELTSEEIEQLRKPRRAVTGEGHSQPKDEAPPPAKDAEDDASKLPWDKIKTRFDAAREFLKQSLRSLDEDAQYVVIFFGTDASPLRTSFGMTKAAKGMVAATIEELDLIKPLERTSERPKGRLRGFTNLHGGLLRAFRATGKGLIERHEHVDPTAYVEGIDTVFVLSDGDPTWDDFAAVDDRDPEDQAGDPETRKNMDNVPRLHYYGPYVEFPWLHLLYDVQRMNMLRHAEIHCVGFGEANTELLESIVKIGHGKMRVIAGR